MACYIVADMICNTIGLGGVIARKHDGVSDVLFKNAHGDVTATVTDGAVVHTYDYDAYGVEKNPDPNDTNPFRYCGEVYDSESGNIYLRNRYYNPSIGRFTQEDPIKDGGNWYLYCGGNPITFVDPLGLAPWEYFKSRDEAAIDAARYANPISFELDEEVMAYIYRIIDDNGNELFYYDEPRNDVATHEARRGQSNIMPTSQDEIVAMFHTHGSYDADTEDVFDEFSTPINTPGASDVDTLSSDQSGLDNYMVSPIGNLHLYVANSGIFAGTIVETNLPTDPKIALHQRMRNTLMWGLLQKNFPQATLQDIVIARYKNPDSWLDAIESLEIYR